jgi:PKD repeat protein
MDSHPKAGRRLSLRSLEDRLAPASLGDFIWSDDNASGLQDAGEAGIAGVVVRLINGGIEVATATTDAAGHYSFDTAGLTAGSGYWLQFTVPAGYALSPLDSGPDDADNDFYSDFAGDGWTDYIPLDPAVTDLSRDGGLVPAGGPGAGLVGDRVWRDDNENGVQDAGEPGIPGVTVHLAGSALSATTDENGYYSIDTSGLAAGNYYLQLAAVPTGYHLSPLDQGGNDFLDNDFYGAGWTDYITIDPSAADPSFDCGLISEAPPPASGLGDRVWRDDNGNGLQDPGEPGIEGVTVRLLDNGSPIATTITDATGLYTFDTTGLSGPNFAVQIDPPAGYSPSPADQGLDDGADSDFTGAVPTTAPLTLTPGASDANVDAGFVPVGPRVSVFDLGFWEGHTGSATATIAVGLDVAGTEPVTVDFATADGTATSPADYTATTGSVTFAPGETMKWVEVPILGDTLVEGFETFQVTLSNPQGGSIDRQTASVTIQDDDPEVSASIDSPAVVEGSTGGTVTFRVTLSRPSENIVGVAYTSSFNGPQALGAALPWGDFGPQNGNLVFAPGEVSKEITFDYYGDSFTEGDETFAVTIAPITGGLTIGTGTGVATILDDDPTTGTLSVTATAFGYATDAGANGSFEALAGGNQDSIPVARTGGQVERRGLFEFDVRPVVEGAVTYALLTLSPGPTPAAAVVAVGYAGDGALDLADATRAATDLAAFQHAGPADRRTLILDRAAVLALTGGSAWLGIRLQPTADGSVTVGTPIGSVTWAPALTFRTDVAPVPTIRVSDSEAAESVAPPSPNYATPFGVYLDVPTTIPVTVSYATADGTATAGADYLPRSGTVTFEPGEIRRVVNIPVVNDDVYELDEAVLLNLSDPSFGTIADPQGVGTIRNEDAAPVVRAAGLSVDEGNAGVTPATFTITRTGATAVPATVTYETRDAQARAGSDYAVASGTLTFGPGETSKTVTVDVLGDLVTEPNESFTFALVTATHATLAAGNATGTIRNDDAPPTVSVTGRTAAEGNAGTASLPFTVSLSNPSAFPVTVNYATANGTAIAGSDYTAASGTLTFAPGETTKTVPVVVTGDTLHEADEAFALTLSGPTNATLGTSTGAGTIANDDAAPAVSVAGDAVAEGDAGTAPLPFAITLSVASGLPVTVAYSTGGGTATAGSDYTAASGIVTFAPGETSKTIPVAVTGETDLEPDEPFTLTLSAPTNATLGTAAATGTIVNDDYPPAAVAGDDRTAAEGSAVAFDGSGSSDPDGDPLTFAWDFGDGATGTGVRPTHAYADDGDYTVTLTVSDGHGGTATDALVVTVTNVDPSVSLPASGSASEASALTAAGSFTDPGADTWTATVNYGDGTGDQPLALNLDRTFALNHTYADNGDYPVTVTVRDDDGATGTESFNVAVANVVPTAALTGATRGVRGQSLAFTASATDPSSVDRAAPFTYTVNWGNGSSQSVSGPATGANLSYTWAAGGTYTVSVTATDKDNGTSATATMTVTVVAAELQSGSLFVGGTNAGERITLRPANTSGGISVAVGGSTVGTFTPAAGGRIVIYAQGGNDTVELLSTRFGGTTYRIAQRSVLYGGTGNDLLDTRQTTGNGVLLGGDGADTQWGGTGRDILVGGLGADDVRGGDGEDVLIGGSTDHDADLTAWAVLQDEWSRTTVGYATRIDHLFGAVPGGLNGTTFLNASAMDNDGGSVDTLYGEGSTDWFVLWSGDRANDRKNGERMTSL